MEFNDSNRKRLSKNANCKKTLEMPDRPTLHWSDLPLVQRVLIVLLVLAMILLPLIFPEILTKPEFTGPWFYDVV